MAELITYNKEGFEILPEITTGVAVLDVPEDTVKWIISGTDDYRFIKTISDHYNLHYLTVEDFFSISHLPKFEIFDDYFFFTLKFPEYNEENDTLVFNHTSLILKKNVVLCFTENKDHHIIEDIKSRIQEGLGTFRSNNADYLFYRIVDLTVDQYLGIVNIIRNSIDDLEDETVEGEISNITHQIVNIKRKINVLRRIALPLKEEIIRVKNTAPKLINPGSNVYFQDILDHLDSCISSLESFREIITELMELRLAQVSHSTNQVMKTLTVVSTIFIPLTFLAGVYGMNFTNMPELHWKWGYPLFWILILIVGLIMLFYMRTKKWF